MAFTFKKTNYIAIGRELEKRSGEREGKYVRHSGRNVDEMRKLRRNSLHGRC